MFNLKFILLNKFFWFSKKKNLTKNKWIIVEYTINPFMNFALIILGKIASLATNSKLLVLITPDIKTPEKHSALVYRALGVSEICYLYDFIKIEGRKILYEFREAKEIISTVDDLYNYSYKGVRIGDLLYDLVLRNKTQKSTVSEINEDLDDSLYSVIATLYFVDHLVKTKKVTYSVFSHPTMLGGVVQRYLLEKYNISGLIGSIHTSIRKIEYLEHERNPFTGHLGKHIIDRILDSELLTDKYKKISENFIDARTSGKLESFDARVAFSLENKVFKEKSEFNQSVGLDPNKKNVFIALHVFNDQPNTYKSIFRDYYEWMRYTLEQIKHIDNVNWIVKEHPSTRFYPTTDFNLRNTVNIEFKEYSHIHFIYSEDKFNTSSVKYIADYIVTCAGSIAVEATCWGIPSLICSQSFYSQFELVDNSNSIEDYRLKLTEITSLKSVSEDKISKAKIVYYLTNGVLWDDTWNNDVFFPKMSFEERTSPNMLSLFNFYLKFLRTKECEKYVDQMIHFINNEKANVFFRDEELSKLEEKD